jgi:uncharacterized membrane protein YbaN (DUF454 family)
MMHKLIDRIPFLRDKKAFIIRYRILFGILLVLLGILGLFLPFLQGIIMILIGLYLLFSSKLKYMKKEANNEKSKTVQKRKKRS